MLCLAKSLKMKVLMKSQKSVLNLVASLLSFVGRSLRSICAIIFDLMCGKASWQRLKQYMTKERNASQGNYTMLRTPEFLKFMDEFKLKEFLKKVTRCSSVLITEGSLRRGIDTFRTRNGGSR